MNFNKPFLISLFVLVFSFEAHAASLGNIWLLGDSVTQARGESTDPDNVPHQWGYRYELWKKLNSNGDSFDFVSAATPPDGSGFDEDDLYYGPIGNTLPEAGFDNNHEGRAGWTTNAVLNNADGSNGNINHWLGITSATGFTPVATPNTTFLFLGLNDIISTGNGNANDIIGRINDIIELIDANNGPDGKIFVGSIYNYDFEEYSQFASQRDETVQANLVNGVNNLLDSSLDDAATLVDLSGLDYMSQTADGLHPNQAGAIFIANQFYDAAVPSAVPVPAAVWLLGSALVGLVGISRKSKITVSDSI